MNFTELVTVYFILFLLSCIFIQTTIRYSNYLYKQISYIHVPPKKIHRFKHIAYYLQKRLYDQTSILHIIFLTLYVLSSVLFMTFSRITPNDWLKPTGTFLAVHMLVMNLLPLRCSPLTLIFGVAYNHIYLFHRCLAYFIWVLSFIHTLAYILNQSRCELQNHPFAIIHLFQPIPRTFGTLAMVFITLICALSIPFLRRNHYTFFQYSHTLSVVLFYVFTALHRPYFIPYAITSLVIFLMDKLLFYVLGKLPRYEAHIHSVDDSFIKLYFDKGTRFEFYAGQHIYMNVPEVSMLEWHPFTIVSAPDDRRVELGIKALGDYTTKLIEYSKDKHKMDIRVYGPFGRFPFQYNRYKEIILISSGIGITPMISVLRDTFLSPRKESMVKTVTLIWVCRDLQLFRYYEYTLNELVTMSNKNPKLPRFTLMIYTKERDANLRYVKSETPNIPEFFRQFTLKNVSLNRRIVVIVCGSNHLIHDTWDACIENTSNKIQYDYYHDVFEF